MLSSGIQALLKTQNKNKKTALYYYDKPINTSIVLFLCLKELNLNSPQNSEVGHYIESLFVSSYVSCHQQMPSHTNFSISISPASVASLQ